jgi:predicted nucleic acid-binding protein
MNNIIVDSGFWYALYDKRDQYYQEANELAEYLDMGNIVMPFPSLYESINTRFTRRSDWMEEFERLLGLNNVQLIDDTEYKDFALNHSFETTLLFKRPISLVDSVIRAMLDDKNLKIDYLLSFNVGDFIDICQRRDIEIMK